MAASSGSVLARKPSCGIAEVSPTDASRHLAQCIVLDIIHVSEEGIDPAGKVLYGQWIPHPFQKIIAPASAGCPLTWNSELRHLRHDSDVVNALIACCNELTDATVRRYALVLYMLSEDFTLNVYLLLSANSSFLFLAGCQCFLLPDHTFLGWFICYSEWVIHPLPCYLVLTGSEVISNFVQGKEADSDIIDVALHRFRQLDATTQIGNVRSRWRHFLESDFTVILN